MGKGRQIAALILHRTRLGQRRALWLSTSGDLRVDAQRDLEDLGVDDAQALARQRLFPRLQASGAPSALPKATVRLSDAFGGPDRCSVLFCTYSLLSQGCGVLSREGLGGLGSAADYRAAAPPGSRLAQVVAFLQEENKENPELADPIIIFDECHRREPSPGNPLETPLDHPVENSVETQTDCRAKNLGADNGIGFTKARRGGADLAEDGG